MSFENTLGSKDWLNHNETALRELFPATWTHVENIKLLPLMFQLKLLGVEWRQECEIPEILSFLKEAGVYAMNASKQVMRNHQHLEFEMTYKNDERTVGDLVNSDGEYETKADRRDSSNPMTPPTMLFAMFTWLGGFALSKGFWSTLLCLCPLWAWYLVIERLFQLWGLIPQ